MRSNFGIEKISGSGSDFANEPVIVNEQDFESDDVCRDPADPDSDSDAEEPGTTLPALQCTGKKPKSGDIVARVLANANASVEFQFQKEWVTEKVLAERFVVYDLSRDFCNGARMAVMMNQVGKTWSTKQIGWRSRNQEQFVWITGADFEHQHGDTAAFADAVLGAGDSDGAFVSQGKNMMRCQANRCSRTSQL